MPLFDSSKKLLGYLIALYFRTVKMVKFHVIVTVATVNSANAWKLHTLK